MGNELSKHQNQIEAQQRALSDQQTNLSNAQEDVLSQQASIINQFRQISIVQSNLAIAQANINTQEVKLNDIDTLVKTLFSNTEDETVPASDTNRVVVLYLGGTERLFFKMQYAPIPYTIQAIMSGGGLLAQSPMLPNMGQMKNILVANISGAIDVKTAMFNFRYIRDIRETNLVHRITMQSSNIICFDGQQVIIQ
jgi:hypothetical protein